MYKIIVVVDAKHAKLYESVGFHIKKLLKVIEAEDLGIHHHTQDLKTGFSAGGRSSTPHFLDPSSDHKDLDREEFSRVIIKEIEKLHRETKIHELIIVTTAKMLGDIRAHFPKSLKNVPALEDVPVREIIKDLTHSTKEDIEKIVFAK